MLHKLRKRAQSEKGFTLIELLVVILIIGILAAIAIPSFLGQRDKANDSAAKADTRSAQTAMETYYTDNQSYSGVDVTKLRAIEPSIPATGLTISGVADQAYKVSTNSKTGTGFSIERQVGGTVVRACTAAGTGGCKAGGSW